MNDINFKPFEIVLSLAGHDKGRLFVVVNSDEEFCYLADGKERKLNSPKRKNIKHIQRFGESVSVYPAILRLQRDGLLTDKQLRKYLAIFRESEIPV